MTFSIIGLSIIGGNSLQYNELMNMNNHKILFAEQPIPPRVSFGGDCERFCIYTPDDSGFIPVQILSVEEPFPASTLHSMKFGREENRFDLLYASALFFLPTKKRVSRLSEICILYKYMYMYIYICNVP